MLLTPPNINSVKVLDCLEFSLRQLQPPASLAGPYVVDRSLDSRLIREDKISLYRQLGMMYTLKMGHRQLMRGQSPGNRGTLGGVKRNLNRIEILISVTITKPQDEAGLFIDSLLSAAIHDLEWRVIYNGFVKTASIALNAANPLWGQAPSCINPLISGVIGHPPKHPSGYATAMFDYLADEYGPYGDSGLL